jgi:hypothetical protein
VKILRTLTMAALLVSAPAIAQDAAKNAAVDRLFKALNADGLYTSLGQGALQSFGPFVAANPSKQKEAAAIIEAEVVPELKANRPVFTRALRAEYAKRMTTAELTQAAAFLESPAGKKLSLAQRDAPAIAADSLKAMQAKIDSSVVPRIVSRFKAAGLKTPPMGK